MAAADVQTGDCEAPRSSATPSCHYALRHPHMEGNLLSGVLRLARIVTVLSGYASTRVSTYRQLWWQVTGFPDAASADLFMSKVDGPAPYHMSDISTLLTQSKNGCTRTN